MTIVVGGVVVSDDVLVPGGVLVPDGVTVPDELADGSGGEMSPGTVVCASVPSRLFLRRLLPYRLAAVQ